jgi:serine/threonine protein kinase
MPAEIWNEIPSECREFFEIGLKKVPSQRPTINEIMQNPWLFPSTITTTSPTAVVTASPLIKFQKVKDLNLGKNIMNLNLLLKERSSYFQSKKDSESCGLFGGFIEKPKLEYN